jgi:hypothetical protein
MQFYELFHYQPLRFAAGGNGCTNIFMCACSAAGSVHTQKTAHAGKNKSVL